MKALFTKLRMELCARRDTVLVSIIAEQGSTPRGTGAQMLVGEKAQLVGTIGGGAVEKVAGEYALKLIQEKRSLVHEFQLRSDSKDDLDMACGGDVRVQFQYISGQDPIWLEVVEAMLKQMNMVKTGWLVLQLDGSAPALLSETGEHLAGVRREDLPAPVPGTYALTQTAFAVPLPMGERALIFGGGHCGLALAPILKSVGFRVTVFDDREEFANWDRFPEVDHVICGDYLNIAKDITFAPDDYVVVMTTGHRHDFEVEEQALRHPLAYIGVMGSAQKTKAVNAKLLDCGLTEADLARVYTPIGINIKGTTPAELAVSIAAEMILVRAQHRASLNTYCPV